MPGDEYLQNDEDLYNFGWRLSRNCPRLIHVGVAGGHDGIGSYYNQHFGQFAAMFRQPEERLLSQFKYFGSFGSNRADWIWRREGREGPSDLREYVHALGGCYVRTLTMDGVACWEPVKPTPSMIREAVRRVEEGFAFIGLAEKWCLSVCLFHEMFGGGFHESEFIKLRKPCRAASSGEVEDLRHYEDVADRIVYHRAKLIFEQRLNEWRVHETQCARRHCEEEMDRSLLYQ